MAAPPIKFPTRPSQTPQRPPAPLSQMDMVTGAEAGRLRYLMRAPKSVDLPVGTSTKIADANGAVGLRYVRVKVRPGSPSQPTFFSSDTSPSASNGEQMTLVGNDIFEQLLVPGEAIYALNNGAVAYSVMVYEVQVPSGD